MESNNLSIKQLQVIKTSVTEDNRKGPTVPHVSPQDTDYMGVPIYKNDCWNVMVHSNYIQ